jgi:hypothetical protein
MLFFLKFVFIKQISMLKIWGGSGFLLNKTKTKG